MAINDSLRDFAKKPLGVKIATFVGAYIAVGLLYYVFFYSDLSDELSSARAVNTQELKKNEQLKDREKKYKELIKQNDQLKEQLLKNRVSLPTSSELPSFFVHLQKQAASSGVSIRTWGRGKEIPVSSYVKVPVAITVSGTFYQILHYFKLLSETDRIITIENLKIGGASVRNDETILTASFTASTFRLADSMADEAEASAGDAPPEPDAAKSAADRMKEKVDAANKKREADTAENAGEAPAESGDGAAAPAPAEGGNGDQGVNRLTNPGAGAPQ